MTDSSKGLQQKLLGSDYLLQVEFPVKQQRTTTAKNKIQINFVDTKQETKEIPAIKDSRNRIKYPVKGNNPGEIDGELK